MRTVAAELKHRHRLHAALFAGFVTVGATLGLVLGLLEVWDRPEIALGDERVRREGLDATVQVTARNAGDGETYCPTVFISARDREGLDLAEAEAVPDFGDGRIPPRGSANFVAEITGLTEREWDEELDEFVAYVADLNPC